MKSSLVLLYLRLKDTSLEESRTAKSLKLATYLWSKSKESRFSVTTR